MTEQNYQLKVHHITCYNFACKLSRYLSTINKANEIFDNKAENSGEVDAKNGAENCSNMLAMDEAWELVSLLGWKFGSDGLISPETVENHRNFKNIALAFYMLYNMLNDGHYPLLKNESKEFMYQIIAMGKDAMSTIIHDESMIIFAKKEMQPFSLSAILAQAFFIQ